MKPLLIVDGYNVIGAWHEAAKHEWSIDQSRDRLMHLLQDFSGYSGEEIILVFDGYQSDRQTSTEEDYAGIRVVYTKHGETADSYIERTVAQTPKYRLVRVATSDALEQSQVLSTGAVRLTSRELIREFSEVRSKGISSHSQSGAVQKNELASRLPLKTRLMLEQLRRLDEPEEKKEPPRKPQPAPVGKSPVRKSERRIKPKQNPPKKK